MILTSEIEGKVLRFRDHPDKRNCILTFFADFSEDSIDELLMRFNCPSVALRVDDWNEELSPWRVPAIFGNDDFGDGAENTLEFILDRVIPLSVKGLSLKDDTRFIIGGYSLAALFSLCMFQNGQVLRCRSCIPFRMVRWLDRICRREPSEDGIRLPKSRRHGIQDQESLPITRIR